MASSALIDLAALFPLRPPCAVDGEPRASCRGRAQLALSVRMLARDWRAGELRVLVVGLLIAVASLTTVAFFADRVRQALSQEASQLLGADLVIVSDRPLDAAFAAEAQRRGLRTVETVRFPSMTLHEGRSQLSEIKAVAPGYPLKGRLTVDDGERPVDKPPDAIPRPGTVWVDERLLARLEMHVGDSIALRHSQVPRRRPADRGAGDKRGFLEPRSAADHEPRRSALDRFDPGRQPGHLPPGTDWRLLRPSETFRAFAAGAGRSRAAGRRRARCAARDPLGAGAGGEVSRAVRAAVGVPGRCCGGSGRSPLSQAPSGRLRDHALPGREPGAHRALARAAVRRAGVRGECGGLRRGLRRPGGPVGPAQAAGGRRAAVARGRPRAAGLCRRLRAAAGVRHSAARRAAQGAYAAGAAP